MAAMRTGIDLVYVMVPEAIREIVSKHSPSLIVRSYDGENLAPSRVPDILELAGKADAICIGPGLGPEAETLEAVGEITRSAGKPLLLDADALKAFSGRIEDIPPSAIVTPHGGEFKALTGEELPAAGSGRLDGVLRASSGTLCVWVVKGEVDIVAKGNSAKLNTTGTACMTVGGTGDCLSGAISALLARGSDPRGAAVAGCFLVGKAGELATEKRGCHLLPTDVAEEIPSVFKLYA
jgi:NAD(P)H-hydrate epimerase